MGAPANARIDSSGYLVTDDIEWQQCIEPVQRGKVTVTGLGTLSRRSSSYLQ